MALVAFEAVLIGSTLFRKKTSVTVPAGDLLDGMGVIHEFRSSPGSEERSHLVDHSFVDFHPFSFRSREAKSAGGTELMAGPAVSRELRRGKMSVVHGPFKRNRSGCFTGMAGQATQEGAFGNRRMSRGQTCRKIRMTGFAHI